MMNLKNYFKLHIVNINVTGPAKLTIQVQKIVDFCRLYHNLITIYTTAKIITTAGFLLQLTQMRYYILSRIYWQKTSSVRFALTWLIFTGPVTNSLHHWLNMKSA